MKNDDIKKDNISEKIKKGVIKGLKVVYDSSKKLCKHTIKEVTFFAKTSIFYITSTPRKDKTNKMFTGILDEKSNLLYIKANKIILYKDYFVEGATIKEDNDEENTYRIIKVDFENKYDYLFKVGRKYQTISCYRITLTKL